MVKTETAVHRQTDIDNQWISGAVGGLVAGTVFGVMIQMMMPNLMRNIGALYGVPGIATGWIAHLFNSLAFGLVYAAIADVDAIENYADDLLPGAGFGMGYGAVLWFVAAGIVMPLWLSALGVEALSVPFWSPMSLVGHLMYGLILGVVFAAMAHE